MNSTEWTKIRAVVYDTILQARKSRVLIILFGIISLILAFYIFGIKTEKGEILTDEFLVSFPMSGALRSVKPSVFAENIMLYGGIRVLTYSGFFFLIFAFAGFLPETLHKGTSDLYLSKPLSRVLFLITKTKVIYLLAILLSSYYFFGLLIIVYWKSGYFASEYILSFALVLLLYSAPIAIMVLFSVLRMSVAMIVVFNLFIYIIALVLGVTNMTTNYVFEPKWIASLLESLYTIFPRYYDMSNAAANISSQTDVSLAPFMHCLIFVAIVMGLAMFIFDRRSYS